MVVQVQSSGTQQVGELLSVAKVKGQVGGNDGLADDLQHLLILAGSQVGENIVPFQLWETKRSIKKQKLHLGGVRLSWRGCSKANRSPLPRVSNRQRPHSKMRPVFNKGFGGKEGNKLWFRLWSTISSKGHEWHQNGNSVIF